MRAASAQGPDWSNSRYLRQWATASLLRPALLAHRRGARVQGAHVDTGERRGHHAEERQDAEAAPEVGIVDEHLAEAALARELAELGLGIGDSGEVTAQPRALLFSEITGYASGRVLTGSTG